MLYSLLARDSIASQQDGGPAGIAMNPIYDATETKPRVNNNSSVSNPHYDMTIASNGKSDINLPPSSIEADNPLYDSSTPVTQGENPIYEGCGETPQEAQFPQTQPSGMNPIYDGLPADYCGGPPIEAYGKTNPNFEYESVTTQQAACNPIYEMGNLSPAADPIYAEANGGDPCYDNISGSGNTGNAANINPIYEESSYENAEQKPRSFSQNRSEPTYSKLSDEEATHSDDASKGLRRRADSKPKMFGSKNDDSHDDSIPFSEDFGIDNGGIDVMNEFYGTIDHDKMS